MEFVTLAAGDFLMGAPAGQGFLEDYESPQVKVTVPAFAVATTPVTNQDFAAFVAATGYVSEAERLGGSLVFAGLLPAHLRDLLPSIPGTPWWKAVPGASWRQPLGPEGAEALATLADHPVVHVSLRDALAYCQWAGLSLPTEAQWEYAARAGAGTTFPWGDQLEAEGRYHANTWQGDFPHTNSLADGYLATAPVRHYAPNAWGLYQVIGNVWEWCANPRYYPLARFNEPVPALDPEALTGEYAIRGGSFLCHASYCQRYRLGARNGADALTTASHIGFRCIRKA